MILLLLVLSSCNVGDAIISEDHQLKKRITRGLGIWSLTQIEDGQINADGTYSIIETIEPNFVYYQFLYRAEVIGGAEAEYWHLNIVEHDGNGTQLSYWTYWIEIQDNRIVIRGVSVPEEIYTVQYSSKNKLELVRYTNVNGAAAEKRTIFLDYCGSCKPVTNSELNNGI